MKILKYLYVTVPSLVILMSCQVFRTMDTAVHFSYGKDGMLLIDGKRTFIIGTYDLPKTENPYMELEQQGYNYVRVRPVAADLDSLRAHNLMGWISVGSIKTKTASEDSEKITGLINSFKKYPALLCWEMEDEPAFTWNSSRPRIKAEPLIRTCHLIKRADPDHFIITNHAPVNLVSTLKKYNPSTDIVSCDVYPVIPHDIHPTYALFADGLQGDLLNQTISQVGEYTDKMQKVAAHNKPVFMVLQAFAWEMLKKKEVRDTALILFPTYEQSRFMAFNAIVHGANGVVYWGSHYTPHPSRFMTDINKVTRELAEMQKILSSPSLDMKIIKTYHEMGHSVDAGVEMVLKKQDDTYYLITVNSDKNPVKITFAGLDAFNSAVVTKENRTVQLKDGTLTDLYKPFDVHIYALQKL